MQTEVQDVKSKSQVVGRAEYPLYDTVDEVVEHETAEAIVRMINAQNRTDAMNRVRSAATSTPSKNKLRQQAMAEISVEEFQQVAGDAAALQALLDAKAEEIAQRHQVTVEDDDDDDE